VVVHTDLNCLSTIQFAIDVLRVRHIVVCGHYGCGGVLAALRGEKLGLVDNWLRHVQDVRLRFDHHFVPGVHEHAHHDRLCELNVIEQVVNVSQTTVVRRRMGARSGTGRARVDLRHPRRAAARPGHLHRWRVRGRRRRRRGADEARRARVSARRATFRAAAPSKHQARLP
jgi:hypothetical protein